MPITINGTGTVTGISAGGLPDGVITTDDIAAGAVTQAKRSEQLTLGTAVASTSGTSIDFTGIPSWVKKITVMFNGVSTSGTSSIQCQLGTSGGIQTTSYASVIGAITGPNTTAVTNSSTGLGVSNIDVAVATVTGVMTAVNISGNIWAWSGINNRLSTSYIVNSVTGVVTLSSTLDRVRITTVNGTDTFDAGSINIMWEG